MAQCGITTLASSFRPYNIALNPVNPFFLYLLSNVGLSLSASSVCFVKWLETIQVIRCIVPSLCSACMTFYSFLQTVATAMFAQSPMTLKED